MDKRTLIFFVSLTLTLFLVNLFFTHQQEERNREWHEQQKVKEAVRQKELLVELQRRTRAPEELPIVDFYSDSEGFHYVTSGIRDGDAVLVTAWASPLPESIYAKAHGSGEAPVLLKRQGEAQPNEPVVYSVKGGAELKAAALAAHGTYDLQMVSVGSNGVHISLGEYRDGALFVPAEDLKLSDEEQAKYIPFEGATVLKKTPQGYLPVGLYSSIDRAVIPLKDYPNLGSLTVIEEPGEKIRPGTSAKQQYYVLENEYQQLVFSNIGGALVEINLPFMSETNKVSMVREIEVDRDLLTDIPAAARFPLHSYLKPTESGKGPYQEAESKEGGYYPLLRRAVFGSKGELIKGVSPHYYALNIVSEYPESAERPYEVTYFDKNKIVFESTAGRRKITRTYSINGDKAPYTLEFSIDIEGDARGLWVTSGVPDVELISGAFEPSLKYRVTRNSHGEVVAVDPPKDTLTFSSVVPDWLSNGNGFFGLIVDPLSPIDPGYKVMNVSGVSLPSRLVMLPIGQDGGKDKDFPGYSMLLPLKNSGGNMKFRLYAGPFSGAALNKVDEAFADPATGYNPDYIASQTFHGWFSFISEPFAKFLFVLMKGFYSFTGSWAISIILLTVALRLMLYPLTAWSMRSTIKMQELAPEIHAINERYKKDPKKAQLETMNLYRERGVNPVSGCFPLLIQLPFLMAMFDLLRSTFELRGACAVPGWIDNLTSPDVLFSWNTPLPLIGNQFHLLPILLGFTMFLQQRMSNPTLNVNEMTEQQRQARAMSTLMAPVFTILFYSFPSGLNIYWLSSTLLGMAQQWWMQRQMSKQKKAGSVVVLEPAPAGKKKKR